MVMDRAKLIYSDESYLIRGAVYEVYRQLGTGFLESVYQASLVREFSLQNIPFVAQRPISIFYKGQELGQSFIADFVCYDKIIVELKVVRKLTEVHEAQIYNYLKATGMKLGLLVNFGCYDGATVDRFVL